MRAAALLLATCACLHVQAQTEPGSAPGTAASKRLPNLPLRRDASGPAEAKSWTPSLWLLAATGAAGGWMAWRHIVRGRRGALSPVRERQAVLRIHSQALTPQASVHALRWNGEELLVGCTAQAVTLLARSKAESTQEA